MCGNADGFAGLSNSLQVDSGCSGSWAMAAGSSRNWGNSDRDVVIVKIQCGCTSHGGSIAPARLVEFYWWLRMASIGVEWRIQVVQSETENVEMETEG